MGVLAATVAAAVTAVGVVSCGPRTPGPVTPPASSQQAGPQPTADVSPAGDIPDNQAFITYTASDYSFTLKVPEGWAKTDVADGVTFTDKFNAITVTSRPTVMAPTVDSVRRDLPGILKATPGYQPGAVTEVNRVGGQAILITYGADSPPNPVTGKVIKQSVERYEFYRSGHQATVTLAAPVGADNVDPWHIVTDSFTWMK